MLIHSEKQCEKKRIAQEKVNQHKKQPHWIAMRLFKILLINTVESCNIKQMALFIKHISFNCGTKRMVNRECQLLNLKRRLRGQPDRNIGNGGKLAVFFACYRY